MATSPEYKSNIDRVKLEPGKFIETSDGVWEATGDDADVSMWHEWPQQDPPLPDNRQDHKLNEGDTIEIVDHGEGFTVKIKPGP